MKDLIEGLVVLTSRSKRTYQYVKDAMTIIDDLVTNIIDFIEEYFV